MQAISRVNDTTLQWGLSEDTYQQEKNHSCLFNTYLWKRREEQVCKEIMFVSSPAFDFLRMEFHRRICRESRSISHFWIATSLPPDGTLWIKLHTLWKDTKWTAKFNTVLFCFVILFFIFAQYSSLWLSSTERWKRKNRKSDCFSL